ncbi:MAG: tRNA (adenosine(37)-N6)-dimethylallyltransferase MiaA, partial [Oscillospiraceae bacterium]
VGGTGLYVDALIRGSDFASFDPAYRAYLSEKSAEELWNMLLERDAARAAVLHEKDLKRVMRSLEVIHLTGETIAEHDRKSREAAPRFDACIIGLTCRDRQTLYERIEARVDEMLKAGLIDEIKTLQKAVITEECTAMQAIGYKELWNAAQGRGELETAVAALKQATRHLAKRQLTWFKRNPAVHWLYMDESLNFDEAIQISTDFIKKTGV